MADLAITEAQVLPSTTSGDVRWGIAGAAIAAGDAVYYDASANTWKLADASALATVKEGDACGIAVCAAEVAAQYVAVQTRGIITLGAGAGPTLGQTYVVSATTGKIALESDIAGTEFTCILGVGSGTNALTMGARGAVLGQTAHA